MKPKILTTIVGYSLHDLAADGIAGITVALVALPLSIAIAIASGVSPASGVITAIVAGFLISALGGSRVQIGGPTSAFIVIVYGIVHDYGQPGLIVATLMAGVILLCAAVLGAGRLIRYVPEPVVEGFTVGIALVIAFGQLKDLLGMAGPALPAAFLPKIASLWGLRGTASLPALIAGLACIGAILGLRRLAPKVPWPLFVVAAISIVATRLHLDVTSVAERYGALPSGLPSPRFPEFTASQLVSLLPSALTIAFLAAVESLLSATVADRMIGSRHRSGAELLAQGFANIVSPLFGGLPATGAIARTATNVAAGGRTPVAGMLHALAILVLLAIAAPLAGALSLPALSGLLIVTAWTMSEPHRWRARLQLPRTELAVLVLTAALTVFADLTLALFCGTVTGLALKAWRRRTTAIGHPMPGA